MITLHIIRHGETDSNAFHRRTGWSNPSLNENGKIQANKLKQWFSDHTDIPLFSSDLARASETAAIASGRTPVLCNMLREQNWSVENQAMLKDRCQKFLDIISPNDEAIIVTHGRTARIIESLFSGEPLSNISAYGNGEVRTVHCELSLF